MSDIEIYRALECCMAKECEGCPYRKYRIYGCQALLIKDTRYNFGRLMREVKE
jgi:hypothetical protein